MQELLTVEEKIRVARATLTRRQPFYGMLVLDMKVLRDDALPAAMGTTTKNGKFILYYNPKLLDEYSAKTIKEILKHEALHHIMNHISRGKDFPAVAMTENGPVSLYNIAADFSINQYLELPDGVGIRLPSEWPQHKSADLYYDMLKQQMDSNKCPKHSDSGDSSGSGSGDESGDSPGVGEDGEHKGDGADGNSSSEEHQHSTNATKPCTCPGYLSQAHGHGHDHWGKDGAANAAVAEEILRQKLQAAKQVAEATNQWGNLPQALRSWIDELLAPKIDWRRVVKNWRGRVLNRGARLTRSRPNRRFMYDAPGRLPDFKAKAVALIDTSGSVSAKLQKRLISEAVGANKEIDIVIVEADACIERVYMASDVRKGQGIQVQGGGGTNFDELLDILCHGKFRDDFPRDWKSMLSNLDGAIFLTDGYLHVTHQQPPMPVIWVYPEQHGTPVEWGQEIVMVDDA